MVTFWTIWRVKNCVVGVWLVLVLKMSGKGGNIREKRNKVKEPQQQVQNE